VEELKPPYCVPCFDRRRFREYSDCRADVASRLYHSGGGRIAQRCHLAARNYKNLFYSGSDSPYLLIKTLRQPQLRFQRTLLIRDEYLLSNFEGIRLFLG